ncbi:MAG: Rv2175c family DNA-binding protein [Mycobacteriales bacterium]
MEPGVEGNLEDLSAEWLSVGEFAVRIGERPSRVKDLIREGRLVTVDIGMPPAASIPVEFVHEGELIKGLAGSLTVLSDAGFSPAESVRWLLTETSALPGRPVDFMAAGRHTAVKRVAMALAF